MSSLQPPKHDSESEDDGDYIPPTGSPDSDSSDDEPSAKRTRTSSPRPAGEDEETQKKAREALWTSFQQSVSTPTQLNSDETSTKMIKIEKRYKFAGEDVVEVAEVPENSLERKKWPLWRPPEHDLVASQSILSPITPSAAISASVSTLAKTPLLESVSKPPGKRPGPRKSKASLIPLPSSSSQKAKKLTTLDKSAMDWRAHVSAEQGSPLKDELEANRRGGGYLEKVEFLKRVDERKEDAIEASRAGKRRKG